MAEYDQLRPIERRLMKLTQAGVEPEELGRRFRRSPQHIQRMLALANLPGRDASGPRDLHLRPLERLVLRWRNDGADALEVGPRLRRSPAHVQRVEAMADYKLNREEQRPTQG